MSFHSGNRKGRWGAVLGLFALVGCGQGILSVEGKGDDAPWEEVERVLIPEASGDGKAMSRGLADGTPQVVYLNFGGVRISDCTDFCSDAPGNRSWAIHAHFGVSTYIDFGPYTSDWGKSYIIDHLNAAFGPYNVNFTTSRPGSGSYTMVVISPSARSSWWGVTPLDCGNGNRNDVVFAYGAGVDTADRAFRVILHELGHTFGLFHTTNSSDVMQWASSGSSYSSGSYDYGHESGRCQSGDWQDGPAVVQAAVGARPAAPPTLPPPSGCGGITYAGTCSGATLTWCENNQLRTFNCSSTGKVCGWQSDSVGNNCISAPPPPTNECSSLGYLGRCDGSTLRWCEGGTVKSYNCASTGKVCGWQSNTVGYNCLSAPAGDTCASLGYIGRCDGSTLKWCQGGVIKTYNCASVGKACGYQNSSIGYNCL